MTARFREETNETIIWKVSKNYENNEGVTDLVTDTYKAEASQTNSRRLVSSKQK